MEKICTIADRRTVLKPFEYIEHTRQEILCISSPADDDITNMQHHENKKNTLPYMHHIYYTSTNVEYIHIAILWVYERR